MVVAIPLAEARARLSEYVRQVETGDPIVITRHGKAAAALVCATDVAQLTRLRAVGPSAGLASVAGGWEGSEELADLLAASPRVGTRSTPGLE